jgi:NodT family efflux transporter outer membrane factor (OMF) lipoprotein
MVQLPSAKLVRLIPLAAALALAACGTVPNLGPKPHLQAAGSYAAARSFAAPEADWPQDRWWEAYNDPELSRLIDEALKGSPTLVQAEARLRAADAAAEVARGATLPSASATAQAGMLEQSREIGFPAEFAKFLPKGFHSSGEVKVSAAYDFDLFGRNRAALAAAVSQAEASRADVAQTRITLSTAVAQAYGELIKVSSQRFGAGETLKNRLETARLVNDRFRIGLETQITARQADAAVHTAEAVVAQKDAEVLVARHRIAALLGQGPDRGLDVTAPMAEMFKPLALPPNLAVDLVGRRPDLVAAKLRAQAAAKRIDVAKADFYPNITLNAYIGQQSLPLEKLFTPAAAIGQFGPALSLPIFEGGRLQGAYRGARADYDSAVADYDHTLTTALQEVADAAANLQSGERQLDAHRKALSEGEAAYNAAKLRYQGGLSSFVDLLSAEDAVIVERRTFGDAQADTFLDDVALVRALGGGFITTP